MQAKYFVIFFVILGILFVRDITKSMPSITINITNSCELWGMFLHRGLKMSVVYRLLLWLRQNKR